MFTIRSLFRAFMAVTLAFSLLVTSSGTALAVKDNPPRLEPDFLKLVQANPQATFKVIVQKDAKNKDLKDMELEDEVLKGGGKVRKHLDMIVSFSAEMTGKEVEKLARNPKVRWISPDAPVISSGTGGLSTVLDTFKTRSYTGNDGTDKWTGAWIEGNNNGDASVSTADTGIMMVDSNTHCSAAYCLKIDPAQAGAYVYRAVNLHNVASATLSLYRYNRLNENLFSGGAVNLQISDDGGATWTTLRTYTKMNYTGSGTDQFDITDYASDNTFVRFFISDTQANSLYIYFDNIQIEYAVSSVYRDVVGAEALFQQTGLDGRGVTVAVVDSGINDHVDLHQSASSISAAAKTSSRIINSQVFGNYANPNDEYEHGTHVAGIIAGNGNASNGKYKGIAPGVNLLNVRVSNNEGLTYTSDLVAGLQWIYTNKDLYNIRVVNLSINSSVPESYNTNPLDVAVEILWFNGITVVVAAGNNGTANGPSTLYPPANDPFVITVGAIEDRGTADLGDDFVGYFSAYGTTESGFAKPDLVAPGRNVISLLAGTSASAYVEYPKHRVDNYYFRMTGTSMAAPVVTGTVALLLQDEPNLTPDQVKYRLLATANKTWSNYSAAKAGAGTVNANAAVNGNSSGSANQGIMPSQMLATGDNAAAFDSVGWNSVGWNSVGWNSVGWNSVGWNSVGWNSVGWNSANMSSSTWDQ